MSRPKKTCNSFRLALENIKDLEPLQKQIIEQRYLCLLENFQKRANFYAFLFHLCRFIITVGSLIVPALLSIQYVDTGNAGSTWNPTTFAFQIYWSTWVISLLVTTANGVFTLFKVDKKYYLLHTMLEQLRSEGWQFLELSGRFSGFYTPREKPSHKNQFLYFCHAVEKIKMKQVEEEYYKSTEANLHTSGGAQASTTSTSLIKNEPSDIETGKIDTKTSALPQIPAFFANGLNPPTPLNPQLQQLLQALTVDGGSSLKQNTIHEGTSEVPVRPEMSAKPTGKESILRPASSPLLKTESFIRVGTEIPTESMEQKPKTQADA